MAADDAITRDHQSTWLGFVKVLSACVVATVDIFGLMAIFLL